LLILAMVFKGRLWAQTFTTLHSFTSGTTNSSGLITNSDGSAIGNLLLSGSTLFGTAYGGGVWGNGTIFSLNIDGTGFRILHTFTASSGYGPVATYTNNDGAGPNGGLFLSGSTLYGVASYGGLSGNGTVFALNTDGTGFKVLYSFTGFNDATNGPDGTNADGAIPYGSVIFSSNRLYGVAAWGGNSDRGTVFSLGVDGTDFSALYSFTTAPVAFGTNSDGVEPTGRLALSGDVLYGTAQKGGDWGEGTVFAVNTNGTFTNLHSFQGTNGGAVPINGLLLSGSTLYGTTQFGGVTETVSGPAFTGSGTAFRVKTDGSDFTTLHNFTARTSITNSDGADPVAGLTLSGNTLYGAAALGGVWDSGTLFALNTDGTGFTVLHSFAASNNGGPNSDGFVPVGKLILSGNTLFGTTGYGGSSGNGTVFKISFAPHLSVTRSAEEFVLSWPTNYAGFDYSGYTLQSATDLASPVWTTNLLAPVVVNGQSIVTNPISGAQKFFRLSQ
jgi:uncharacterized repeat protein (TIGR03803 family)